MPRWLDVEKTQEYQEASNEDKTLLKGRFYWENIKDSERYKSLSQEEQNKVFDEFAGSIDYKKAVTKGMFKGLWGAWKELPGVKQGDILVETISKKIEPKVPPGRTTLGLLTKDLPRQVIADVARAYKPSTLLPFIAGTKAIKPLVKPAAKAIGKKIPEPVKKFFLQEFTIGKGQPKLYQEALRKTKLEKAAGVKEAQDVAKILSTKPTGKLLTGKEQRIVGRIFRGQAERIKQYPKYKEYRAIADEGRAIMDKWSQELIKSGIPSAEAKEIIRGNIGIYMGRMFDYHFIKNPTKYSSKAMRLRLDGLKHRKDLSTEVLRQMGEIKAPALPTAIRVKEISTSIANNKLFNQVAKNPEWVAKSNVTGTMVKMPKGASVGALKGKWVIPEIANDINAITAIKQKNIALEAYSKALGMWKYSKVVLNPATHVRNMISNSMLLDMSGVNHIRQMQLMPRVIKDYVTKGKLYQLAVKHGAIGDEFIGGDVAQIGKYYNAGQGGNLSKWMNVLKAPFKKAGDIYQGEEQISKMVKFADMLSKRATPQAAAKEAQKWLFNYQEIPNAVKVAKQIAPFITFTYKALPRVGETLVNNPLKVYKYYALAKGFNESSRKMLNMRPQEFAKENKMLPPWLMKSIGGMPTNLLMPWKDKFDRTQWLNLEYILPLGMGPEIMQRGIKGLVGNPLVTLFADLSKNQDFKGQDIIPVGSTPGEAAKIITEYIYRQIAPSLSPGLWNVGTGEEILKGGYSFEKILSAIYQRPDYADRTRSIGPVLFDVLMGLKLTPLDVEEAEMFKTYDKKRIIEDLNTQILKLNHPAISEKTRNKKTEDIFKKIQRVLEK